MNEMLVIIPSRGRPNNVKRFYEACVKTKAKVDIIIGIDYDDPKLQDYYSVEEKLSSSNVQLMSYVNPIRRKFGPTLNVIATEFCERYKYIYWCGDDHLPITENWDQKYRDELDKLGTGIVYGNDLVMGSTIPTQMAVTSDIVKILGYAVPEGFIHLYIDNYFLELGKALGKITYLPDVIVQHLHPCAGQAEEDQTYKEANSPENWSNDQARFEKYMQEELYSDVEKLRRYIEKEVD